jgi:hypothetical protein
MGHALIIVWISASNVGADEDAGFLGKVLPSKYRRGSYQKAKNGQVHGRAVFGK